MINLYRFKNQKNSMEIERKIINFIMSKEEYSCEEEIIQSTSSSKYLIPLAYTTKGDYEEFEIQVYLDVEHMRIVKELTPYEWDEDINQYYYEYEYFASIEKFLEFIEDVPDFDELIEVEKDIEDIKEAMQS